jgi:hypothetical protein
MDKRENMISFRLNDEEFARVDLVIKRVLSRNRYIKKADVYRELFGLVDTGAISIEEKDYLKGERLNLPGSNESPTIPLAFSDNSSPNLFHSIGNDKPANTKSRAIQKDIQSVKEESKRRIRQMKEKGTKK